MLAAGFSMAGDLSVAVSGKYHDPVASYAAGPALYLGAAQAGELYGAQVYWYQVAGRVQMTLRGRGLTFFANSKQVTLDTQKTVDMESPVLLRGSEAWIPLSFLQSPQFSSWSGFATTYDPRTLLLSIDKRSTVGSVRWFSYKDFTRLEMEADARLTYTVQARGLAGVEVEMPLGAIDGSEDGQIGDGVVGAYALTQAPRTARLAVKLAQAGLRWQAHFLENPHRIALDVFRKGAAPAQLESQGLAAAPVAATQTSRKRILIDPGHGGKDPGATGRRGTQEKDINLLAAKQLAKLLTEEGVFDVRLTRTDDTFIPLSERSRMANDWPADLFVSLHCNASKTPADEGFEVYFMSEHASDPQAEQLADFENSSLQLEGKASDDTAAQLLLGELSKTEFINSASQLAALMARDISKRVGIEDRGVKQAGFYVLRGTHAPAVLFEMAYLTNPKDEVRLQSRKFRRKLVDGIYAGVIDYAKRQGWLSEVAGK